MLPHLVPTLMSLIFPDGHPSTVKSTLCQEFVTSEQLRIRQQSQHAVVTLG